MRVEPFDTPDQLRERARRQDDPVLATRLLGLALAMEKKTAPEVAAAVGYSRETHHFHHELLLRRCRMVGFSSFLTKPSIEKWPCRYPKQGFWWK